MFSQIRPALIFVAFFSVLLGLAYPLFMTGLGKVVFPDQAGGSLLTRDGVVVGSSMIGQEFTKPEYLHGRPSATDPAYSADNSGGSNLAPSSAELLDQVKARAESFGTLPVPSEMATASASGLDPHITMKAAMAQVSRIAEARGISDEQVIAAINSAETGPAFGFVGARIVNVLKANLALDALKQ